jgi:type VI secretion system protein ImpD
LSSAKVEVREHPGRPGSFACVVHLKPHFQVEHVVSAVKLVTEFAPAQA